jgi:hypothetical protein
MNSSPLKYARLDAELRETFSLTADDLPEPPDVRMKKRPKSDASVC